MGTRLRPLRAEIQLRDPPVECRTVHLAPADLHHSRDVPEVAVRSPRLKKPQLVDDDVLDRRKRDRFAFDGPDDAVLQGPTLQGVAPGKVQSARMAVSWWITLKCPCSLRSRSSAMTFFGGQ